MNNITVENTFKTREDKTMKEAITVKVTEEDIKTIKRYRIKPIDCMMMPSIEETPTLNENGAGLEVQNLYAWIFWMVRRVNYLESIILQDER
jgi:hypothetical protein